MRRLIVALVLAGLLALATAAPVFAQGPPSGSPVGNENCEGRGLVPDGGNVSTLDTTDTDGENTVEDPDIRQLTITVVHGPATSTHTITYEDNDGSDTLTCGDTILDIS